MSVDTWIKPQFFKHFSRLCSTAETDFFDWNEWERKLSLAANAECFLGGDSLRPYAILMANDKIGVVSTNQLVFRLPPIIDELTKSAVESYSPEPNLLFWQINENSNLFQVLRRRMLNMPRVLLIGLGAREKYQYIRLNLGVARLAQWVRFCGVGRVDVLDYFLTEDGPSDVSALLSGADFDVIGTSVNFGQWHLLEELIPRIAVHNAKFFCFGNILAASARTSIEKLLPGRRVEVCASLGEGFIRKLCENVISLASPTGDDKSFAPALREIDDFTWSIFPDPGLLEKTCAAGGQLSFETSLGCQYGHCTFCPRSHRGDWWIRSGTEETCAILSRLAKSMDARGLAKYVSIVDEEFFGSENNHDAPHAHIINACRNANLQFEIYTRVDNVFCRSKGIDWNISRCSLLTQSKDWIRRMFTGVESGSASQLKRYGKGQTTDQIVDYIRIASSIGLPIEFGFITFDPLMSQQELYDNILFLARTDSLGLPGSINDSNVADRISDYYQSAAFDSANTPLYNRVSYMATELEVLASSPYLKMVQNKHPELLTGEFDERFARFGVKYLDPVVEKVVNTCRFWTETIFPIVYKQRLIVRSNPGDIEAANFVMRYRTATFELLVTACSVAFEERAPITQTHLVDYPTDHADFNAVMSGIMTTLAREVFQSSTLEKDLNFSGFDVTKVSRRIL